MFGPAIAFSVVLLQSQPASTRAPFCPENCDINTIGRGDIPKDAPRFSDYPAPIIPLHHLASPDVSSPRQARLYRTFIKAEARRGVNFAGHYSLLEIGCGAGASCVTILDERSGKVFFPRQIRVVSDPNVDPDLQEGGDRVGFKPDSRLIIVAGELNEDSRTRGITYFVWEKDRLRTLRIVRHAAKMIPRGYR